MTAPATNPILRATLEPDHVYEQVVTDLGIDPAALLAEIATETRAGIASESR